MKYIKAVKHSPEKRCSIRAPGMQPHRGIITASGTLRVSRFAWKYSIKHPTGRHQPVSIFTTSPYGSLSVPNNK